MKIVAMENNTNTPMLHAALVYQIKKSRGINWTPSEKVRDYRIYQMYLLYPPPFFSTFKMFNTPLFLFCYLNHIDV
jgi:hypothetical protein